MKIVYLVHQFLPRCYTGTEKFVLNLASTMQQWGHEVKIITFGINDQIFDAVESGVYFKNYKYKGLPVMSLKYDLPDDELLGLTDTDRLKFIGSVLEAEQPDLVHVGHPMRMEQFVTASQLLEIPYLITLTDFYLLCVNCKLITAEGHSCVGPSGGRSCRARCPDYAHLNLERRLEQAGSVLAGAQKVMVPSRTMGSVFLGEFPELDVAYAPYGIDYSRMRSNRKRYGKDDAVTFCYAGQLGAHKGVHVLVDAFRQVSAEDASLLIYGSGSEEYESRVRAIAQDDPRIRFCGVYNEDYIGRVYSGVDVATVPSLWMENNTISMNEALACEVPVMVSDVPGMSERVREAVDGFIVGVGRVDDWRQRMQAIVDDPSVLNELKENIAREPVQTTEQEAHTYLQEYERILRGRASGESKVVSRVRDAKRRADEEVVAAMLRRGSGGVRAAARVS